MNSSTIAVRPTVTRLPDITGLGGAVAGLGGGIAMAVVAAIISQGMGGDIWLESKQIAAAVYGTVATEQPGFVFGPVVVGTILHLIVSMFLGAIFGIMSRRVLRLTTEFGVPLFTGLVYGMLIWMVAYFLILPIIDPVLMETYAPTYLVQHIVYGLVTGLLYGWLRPQPYNTDPASNFSGGR